MIGDNTVDKTASVGGDAGPAENDAAITSTVRDRYITWPTDSKCLQSLLTVHYVEDDDAQANFSARRRFEVDATRSGVGLMSALAPTPASKAKKPEALPVDAIKTCVATWQTDANGDHEPADEITVDDLPSIMTRVDKDKALQKARTKAKAEVFTPSWVCAKMNGEVDARILRPDDSSAVDPFGRIDSKVHEVTDPRSKKTKTVTTSWFEPNVETVDCSALDSKPGSRDGWLRYLTERRLEITCGEAPYLCSRYDATTGDPIPVVKTVVDAEGVERRAYARHGLLDRKLRVLAEQTQPLRETESREAYSEHWLQLSTLALKSCYGYEWQGDSLLLARANMVEDMREWWLAVCWPGAAAGDKSLPIAVERAWWEIVSWNIWQADGLKNVLPCSCPDDCKACAKVRSCYVGHDGKHCVVRLWKNKVAARLTTGALCPKPARGEVAMLDVLGGLGGKLMEMGEGKSGKTSRRTQAR